jgi:hypothetical protein
MSNLKKTKSFKESLSDISESTKISLQNFSDSTKPFLNNFSDSTKTSLQHLSNSTKNSLQNLSTTTKPYLNNLSDSTKSSFQNLSTTTKPYLNNISTTTKNSISNISEYSKQQLKSRNFEDTILSPKNFQKNSKNLVDSDDEETEKFVKGENIFKKTGCNHFYPNNLNPIQKSKELKVCVCTWNAGSSFSASIGPWIFSHEDCDIYAIGLQEVDMTVKTIIKNESECLNKWDEHFDFHSKKYSKLISQQLVGLYHVLYIKKEHLSSISKGF